MTTIIKLIKFEEGFSEKPYYCSEGFPTIAFGVKIGPRGASLSNYTFTVPEIVGELWLTTYLDKLIADMERNQVIVPALAACGKGTARYAALVSMAYQMGVGRVDVINGKPVGAGGLSGFNGALRSVAESRWSDAAVGMLQSKWAQQTPNRSRRHAEQMRTGKWCAEYK